MPAEQITARQSSAMLFFFLAGGFDPFLARYVAADAGRGALLSVLLATGLALLLVLILLLAARRFLDGDLLRYGEAVWGSPLGQTAGAWYVLLLVFGAALPLAAVGLVGDVALGWRAAATPPLLFVLAVLCALTAGQGFGTVARISEYAAPAAFILALVTGLTVWDRVDWANYAALPAGGWGAVGRGAVHLLGRFALAYILLFLAPWTDSFPRLVRLAPVAVLAAGLVLAVGTLPVGLYTGGVAAVTFLPPMRLLGDSVFGVAPWLFRGAVDLWLLELLLAAVIALRLLATAGPSAGPQRFLAPVAVAYTGLLVWSNAGASFTFGQKVFPYLVFPAAIVWPLLLLGGPGWRRLRAGERLAPGSRAGEAVSQYGLRLLTAVRSKGLLGPRPLWPPRHNRSKDRD